MPAAELRIGFVGCGRATEALHLPAITRVAGLRAVAAADSDPAALASVLRRAADVKGYEDYRQLIDDPSVDVVAVCVPPFLHAAVATAALASGKHVYLEKPLAVSLDDATAIRAAADVARSKITLGFNLRSHRLLQRARVLIANGGIGAIELFRSSWTCGSHLGREWPAWRFDRSRGGGAFHEIAVHHLDLLRYLLTDEIRSISAQTRSDEMIDQCIVLDAQMRSGALASLSVSQRTADGNDIEVYGRRGVVTFSCYRADSFTVRRSADLGGGVRARLSEGTARLRGLPAALVAARAGGDFRLSYAEHWRRFARSIRHGEPLPATVDDGERALAAVLAAVRSAESGTRVDLEP